MRSPHAEKTFDPIKTDFKIFEFIEATESTKKSIWNELKSGFYKHYMTHGLPIFDDLFHFIANIVSIFIDHKFVKNIYGKYEILRYLDNYDIFAKTTEQSEIVMNAFVQVFSTRFESLYKSNSLLGPTPEV